MSRNVHSRLSRGAIRLVAAAAAFVFAPAMLDAQAVLRGVARDSAGRGVPNVEVALEGTGSSVRTDSAGSYLLRVAAGSYAAIFRVIGFEPVRETVRLADGDTLTRDITLAIANAQQLEAVDVRARRLTGLAGFEERRRMGLGSYIDSVQLRREEGRRLGDMVRQMRGIKIVVGPRGQLWAVNPTKTNLDGMPSCYASVYLDRVLIYRSGGFDAPPDLGRDFLTTNLDAVEWYRGSATVPTEFGIKNSDCGVLVLWTRRGR